MARMKRHYFISDDLDDLDMLEAELEREGVCEDCIRVLSLDDAAVEHRDHLHSVQSLMKQDVVRSGNYGLLIGSAVALLTLGLTWLFEWHHATALGWIPFIFLAVVLFGFFTWEAALIGMHNFNGKFRRFRRELEDGNHVFFVDIEDDKEEILRRIRKLHPRLRDGGTGKPTPQWIIRSQRAWRSLP